MKGRGRDTSVMKTRHACDRRLALSLCRPTGPAPPVAARVSAFPRLAVFVFFVFFVFFVATLLELEVLPWTTPAGVIYVLLRYI